MSRIGNRIINIPENVEITVEGEIVKVKGPLGELSTNVTKHINVKIENGQVALTRNSEIKPAKMMHGTSNANIVNMIEGVTNGYSKGLEILGVGYRFIPKGETLTVNAGYSHPVEVVVPNGITLEGISNTEIVLKGIDKQMVGEFAANIRKIRKPEPYKGKGIRYKGEVIRRKEGKKASK